MRLYCRLRYWRIAIACVLAVAVVLGAIPPVARAQAGSPPSESKAAAPSASAAAAIAAAKALADGQDFARAVAVLARAQAANSGAEDANALDFALADTQYRWGRELNHTAHFADATPHFEAALAIDARYPVRRTNYGMDLFRLGVSAHSQGLLKPAVGYYERALIVLRETGDIQDAVSDLIVIGQASFADHDFEKAIPRLEEVIPMLPEPLRHAMQAELLTELGLAYQSQKNYEKSIDRFSRALQIYGELQNTERESNALIGLANTCHFAGRFGDELDYSQRALSVIQATKDSNAIASALVNVGVAYQDIDAQRIAIDKFTSALQYFRIRNDDFNGEAGAITNIGLSLTKLGELDKAIANLQEAVPLYEKSGDKGGEAALLTNLGYAYYHKRDYDEDRAYLQRALPLYHALGKTDLEAIVISNLGVLDFDTGHRQECISHSFEALRMVRGAGDRAGEALVLGNLMTFCSAAGSTEASEELAICYGKLAVGILQNIRGDIRAIDKKMQFGYLQSKSAIYRYLADMLIAHRRNAEAVQILDLLREEEYLNFSRPASAPSIAESLSSASVSLTPIEKSWSTQAAPDLNVKYDAAAQNRLEETSDTRELQMALRTLGDGSVAVYCLAIDKTIRLILVTPDKIVERETQLKDNGVIDAKIVAFRAVLQNPKLDPRPLGKELYDMLIGPLQADLEESRAKTLLVSLDGNLRYIPLAALSPDGTHFLVETYRTALYTPAALANLTRLPRPGWTALGMGVSEVPGYVPLPGVETELRSIVRAKGDPDGGGRFPGVRLLNGDFTEKNIRMALRDGYPLVHIASHFVFTGDEKTSYLLLGDGTRLTLAELKALPDDIFAGVDLLTLSACETATGGIAGENPSSVDDSRGSGDVENFAVLAQRKGAAAVIASLWSVPDASTGLLMREFYRNRQTPQSRGAAQSKGEALREAQVALIFGRVGTTASASNTRNSEPFTRPPSTDAAHAPKFPYDPERPWAHPYYWASFILIGNTR